MHVVGCGLRRNDMIQLFKILHTTHTHMHMLVAGVLYALYVFMFFSETFATCFWLHFSPLNDLHFSGVFVQFMHKRF